MLHFDWNLREFLICTQWIERNDGTILNEGKNSRLFESRLNEEILRPREENGMGNLQSQNARSPILGIGLRGHRIKL